MPSFHHGNTRSNSTEHILTSHCRDSCSQCGEHILRMFENVQQYKYFSLFFIEQLVFNMLLQRFIEQHYDKDALACRGLEHYFSYLYSHSFKENCLFSEDEALMI